MLVPKKEQYKYFIGDLRYEAIWEAYIIGHLLKQLKRVDKVHSFAEDN